MTKPVTKRKSTRKPKLTPEMESAKWKPGQSGNPEGRPKKFTTLLSDAIREKLGNVDGNRSVAEELADVLIEEARSGQFRVKAIAEIRDTTEGRPAQTVKVDGNIAITASERAQRIAALVARAVNAAAQ